MLQLTPQSRIFVATEPVDFRGIHVTRDRVASVRYSERLNSSKSSFSFQRTDRYGIVGQKHSHFQRDS